MPQSTSVLVGSRPAIPTASFTITANAEVEACLFAGGSLYLHHNTGSLSLLTALTTTINSHSELVGTSIVVTRSRRVLITNATAFALNWGADVTVRDLLGFTGNLASSTSHLATHVSPLLWAPAKVESTAARMGSDGVLVKDTYAGRSAPGVVVATQNNSWAENVLTWRYVHVDRIEQVPDVNGTWATWWNTVASRFRRFYCARNVTEDSGDTSTAMDLTTSRIPAVGRAYIMRQDGPIRRAHDRTVPNLELFNTVDLEVETALEYGA